MAPWGIAKHTVPTPEHTDQEATQSRPTHVNVGVVMAPWGIAKHTVPTPEHTDQEATQSRPTHVNVHKHATRQS